MSNQDLRLAAYHFNSIENSFGSLGGQEEILFDHEGEVHEVYVEGNPLELTPVLRAYFRTKYAPKYLAGLWQRALLESNAELDEKRGA